jgi:hypothetical protein
MIPGISGSLLSHDALERVIPEALRGRLGEVGREEALRRLRAWHRPLLTRLGPSASARTVFDQVAGPLVANLGYRSVPLTASGLCYTAVLDAGGVTPAVLLVTPWGQDLSTTWREAVRQGIGCGARWCLCVSGPFVRLADSQRTYSRRFLEFDLQVAVENDATFAAMWGLLRAGALVGSGADGRPTLDRAVALSDQHRLSVRDSLQLGVEEALTRLTRAFVSARARRGPVGSRQPNADRTADEALIVIYRVLFLLFAEARGLVPQWHPVFRDGYTIEALRKEVELVPRPPGLWEALQAISRLAHRGCHAGSLRVPPFNGRLFSPAHAPLSDVLPLDDGAVRQAMLALTTRPARPASTGRERIAYGDLGVEQLGGVYERLLDFRLPEDSTPVPAKHERRKATGSFYTPRSLTEYLVRRTLAPLVQESSSYRILELRVIDPAMGSGAFLVAACRYLAGAYEMALVREGAATTPDISEADRAGFRRAVAQRCLYGVDVNPMAVQLARLSLWLATLAADRPLTFLDHHLRTGDSLVGASAWDVLRQPPPGRRARERPAPLPLFEHDALGGAIGAAVGVRMSLALGPGDTLDQVRAKERALARLEGDDSELTRWKRLADTWCSGWFRDLAGRAELRAAFHELVDAVLTGRSALPDQTVTRLLLDADAVAADRRFFHWAIEFPEVFHDAQGQPLPDAGFDAVIGNPPWEMLRGDHGSARTRTDARVTASRVSDFARGAGIYRLQGDGHVNLYQLFVERALSLVRPDGRLGLILPSGFATDHGCGALRRALLNRTLVDTFDGFENRDGVFPIHRSLKFLLLTAQAGRQTREVPGRFGLRRPEALDQLPDTGADDSAVPLTRRFLERLSGPLLVVPEIRTMRDLEIVTEIAFGAPALGHPEGWQVSFGRELNATDDKQHFVEHGAGIPVIDGKHIQPFSADPARARFRIPARMADRLAGARGAHRRPRLAYRDVASPTNRLTLIAAIVPAGVLTTHTLFCAKEPLDEPLQLFLCGMLNSFVANYLVRLQVGTHVTASLMSRLPVPKPPRDSLAFRTIVSTADALRSSPADAAAHARLQACAARLYGLTRGQLAHVLESFPLVSVEERTAVLLSFAI